MNDQRIGDLLRHADDNNVAHLPSGFAQRVRRLAGARKRKQRWAGGAIAAAVLAVVVWRGILLVGNPAVPKEPPTASGGGNSQIPDGDALAKTQSPYDVLDPIARARDETACAMVFMARKQADTAKKDQTRDEYLRTVALFPESPWAQEARKELDKLNE